MTDINLPDGSGLDVAREALRQNPRLPVIVCSGHDLRDVARSLGPTAHPLRKPVDLDELEALVERLVRRST
jgi:DNA-binding response OmpR family regulator